MIKQTLPILLFALLLMIAPVSMAQESLPNLPDPIQNLVDEGAPLGGFGFGVELDGSQFAEQVLGSVGSKLTGGEVESAVLDVEPGRMSIESLVPEVEQWCGELHALPNRRCVLGLALPTQELLDSHLEVGAFSTSRLPL